MAYSVEMGQGRCTFSGLTLKPLFILVGVTALVGCNAADMKGVGITVLKTTASPTPTPSVSPSPGSSADVTAPTASFSAPSSSGQTYSSASLVVSGSASDTSGISLVTVNGVAATGTTSWSRTITLSSGSNTITVVVTDNSSNRNTRTVTTTATYTPPVPSPTPSPSATATPSPTPTATGTPSAPTGLTMSSPATASGPYNPTITVSGVTAGNTVYIYDSSTSANCAFTSGSAVATGSTVNVTIGLGGVGKAHTLYAIQSTPGNVNSPCSTASLTYLYGIPFPPSSLTMNIPSTTSGTNSKPTITVNGVQNGGTVWLYKESTCTTVIASKLATSTSVNIQLSTALPVGPTTFWATTTNSGSNYHSQCSTASLTYTYTPPDAPTNLTMNYPLSMSGSVATPVISVSGTVDGNTVSLYSDAACTVLKGTTLANSGALITSSAIPTGATTFYAKQVRPDGASSLCSTAKITYTYTGPVSSTPGLAVTQVATGMETTCAIVAGGRLKCWGQNSYGELRDGTNTPSNVPVDIPGFTSGVTAVAAGSGVVCVIHSGAIKCWGSGTLTLPYPSIQTHGTDTFTKIALYKMHVCGITTGGALRCFGQSLGQKTNTTGLDSGVTAVSVSNEYSCAIQNGALKCWGCNYSDPSALGIGFGNDCGVPSQVIGLESGVTAVSQVGEGLTCAVHNGALKCWGVSFTGLTATAAVVPGFESGVTNVFGQCALKNGDYKCFTTGAMPTGVTDLQSTKVGSTYFYTYGIGVYGVKAVPINRNGAEHSCYHYDSNDIKCFGANGSGELGNGTFVDSLTPVSPTGF